MPQENPVATTEQEPVIGTLPRDGRVYRYDAGQMRGLQR